MSSCSAVRLWTWAPAGQREVVPLGTDSAGLAWCEVRGRSSHDEWGVPYRAAAFRVSPDGQGERVPWFPAMVLSSPYCAVLSPTGRYVAYLVPKARGAELLVADALRGEIVYAAKPRCDTILWVGFCADTALVEYGVLWDPERRQWARHDLKSGASAVLRELGSAGPCFGQPASRAQVVTTAVAERMPGRHIGLVALEPGIRIVGERLVGSEPRGWPLQRDRVLVAWPNIAILDVVDSRNDVVFPPVGRPRDVFAPDSGEWVGTIVNGRELKIWSASGELLLSQPLGVDVTPGDAACCLAVSEDDQFLVSIPGSRDFPGRMQGVACFRVEVDG